MAGTLKFILLNLFWINLSFGLECSKDITSTPPFYVSDEYKQGDKIWENLRNLKDDTKKEYYIPRGSIVHTPQELLDNEPSSDYRVPIEVISVPKDDNEETLRNSRFYKSGNKKLGTKGQWMPKADLRQKIYGNKGLKRAEKGTKGFIDKRSLRKVNEYSFLVKTDSQVYKDAKGEPINDRIIKLKMESGLFIIEKCCEPLSAEQQTLEIDQDIEESDCFIKYIFDSYDNDGKYLSSASYNLAQCDIAQSLLPVPKKATLPIQKVLDLARNSDGLDEELTALGIENMELFPKPNKWSGSNLKTKPDIALMKFPLKAETNEGPYNSYHYNQDDKTNSDALVTPTAACGFMQILKAHNKECKDIGCKVMFGDMYHASGQGHATHGEGNCIDIRPFRKKDDIQNSGLTHSNSKWSRYSRDKTRNFMKLLIKAGVRPIYFNDQTLINEFKKADSKKELRPDLPSRWASDRFPKKVPAHDNHLHVCFPENDEMKKLCKNGVK